jgi:hypothetical protein
MCKMRWLGQREVPECRPCLLFRLTSPAVRRDADAIADNTEAAIERARWEHLVRPGSYFAGNVRRYCNNPDDIPAIDAIRRWNAGIPEELTHEHE